MCICVLYVSMQTPECLGNPERKGPGHRTSLLQGPLPAADPLISGNKEGRACNSSKIACGVGGVEGCSQSDAMPYSARISYGQLKKQRLVHIYNYKNNIKQMPDIKEAKRVT